MTAWCTCTPNHFSSWSLLLARATPPGQWEARFGAEGRSLHMFGSKWAHCYSKAQSVAPNTWISDSTSIISLTAQTFTVFTFQEDETSNLTSNCLCLVLFFLIFFYFIICPLSLTTMKQSTETSFQIDVVADRCGVVCKYILIVFNIIFTVSLAYININKRLKHVKLYSCIEWQK